jgi:hypothetical protein
MNELRWGWNSMSLPYCSIVLATAYNATEANTSGSQDYQNGWKDCYNSILNTWSVFYQYVTSLATEAQKEACAALLTADVIRLVYEDNKVQIIVPCSDTFAYAMADQEYIEPTVLPCICYLYDKWKTPGVIAWLADYRACDPLKCLQCEKYEAAMAWLHDDSPPF